MKEEEEEWEHEWTDTLLLSAAKLLMAVELLQWSLWCSKGCRRGWVGGFLCSVCWW